MAYNLFDLTYRVARELRVIYEGVATGGDTTSLIDTVLLARFNDDYFNYGSVWIIYDAAGAGAAPQGEYARVSDFATSGDATLAAALTVAIAAGDRYAISTPRFTLDDMISQINAALEEIPVKTVDTTTIDTASAQTEYTMPTGVLDEFGIMVDRQTVTGDANDNRWIPHHDWYIEETGTGTAKKLIFTSQPQYAFDVRITYYIPHPPLYVYTSKLRESVDLNRVVLDAAYRCLMSLPARLQESDPNVKNRIQELAPRVERAKWRSPAKVFRPKLATYGHLDHYVQIQD